MKTAILAIVAAALFVGVAFFNTPADCARGCGLKPLKPLLGMGCVDMVAECICDANGRNCYWVWRCVTR
jgi:hypothetical protein